MIDKGMRDLRAGTLTPAKARGIEKKVLDWTEQRFELQSEHDSLRVRRKPKKKGSGRGRQQELI